MDKYKEIDYVISVFQRLKDDKFSLLDVVIVQYEVRKISRRKKKQQYYRRKLKESGKLTMQERYKLRETDHENLDTNTEKAFLDWLIEKHHKWIAIADKYYGWISSSKLRELYSEFKNEKISSWQFVNMLKDKYGNGIYKMKRYHNKKYYRAINLGQIFEINKKGKIIND